MSTFHPLTHFISTSIIVLLLFQTFTTSPSTNHVVNGQNSFQILEATIEELQKGFNENKLNSRELVDFYLQRIKELNPTLRAVIEVNPDALEEARKADETRAKANKSGANSHDIPPLGALHGIPILIKDSIGTKDKLNTTAGSFALLGCHVNRDAGVVSKLRKAGAIILGKASLSEWYHFRSFSIPNGWSARGGQGKNPYNLSADPCGSSSGSAIAVAANLVSISLGTETHGSILCPSSSNSVVGIKPTVGLTSRSGVIPVSPLYDTIGPICRTVADAVHVLDAIVGFDPHDSEATKEASRYIPAGGYAQFLNVHGLEGKRLGIIRNPFFAFREGSVEQSAFKQHFETLRERGAILIDGLEIPNLDAIRSSDVVLTVLLAEFKLSLNSYFAELEDSPVRSLEDVIQFNLFSKEEMIGKYGQELFISSEATNGIGGKEKEAIKTLAKWSREGFEKVMHENELDAIITPRSGFSSVLAIGGYPGINVPAGYDNNETPFGICFGGLKGSESNLIEIAYAFEQATKIRKSPGFGSNGECTHTISRTYSV